MKEEPGGRESGELTFTSHGKEVKLYLPNADDHIQRAIARERGFYESEMLEDIYSRALPGAIAFDVGANVGNHTVFLSKICGLRVVALEPLPQCFEILKRNIEINGVADLVKAMPVAAGRERGRGEAVITDVNNLGATHFEKKPDGSVEMFPLDDLNHDGPVSIIKIDVEQMGLEVLEGAAQIISEYKPYVYIEISDRKSIRKHKSFMKSLGYQEIEQFNWTPTFLFVPARSDRQQFGAVMSRLDRIQINARQIKYRDRLIQRLQSKRRHFEDLCAAQSEEIVEKEEKVKELLAQLKQSKDHNKTLAEKIVIGGREAVEQQSQLERATEQCEISSEKIAQKEKRITELQEQLEQLKDRYEKLAEKLANVEREDKEQRTQLMRISGQRNALNERIALKEDKINELQEQLKIAEGRYESLAEKSAHRDQDDKKLQAQLTQIGSQREVLHERIALKEEKIRELQTQLEQSKGRFETLAERKNLHEQEERELLTQLVEALGNSQVLEEKITLRDERAEELKSQLKYSEGRLEELNGEVVLKAEKIGELQARLKQTEDRSNKLAEAVDQHAQEKKELQAQLVEATDLGEALSEKIALREEIAEELKSQIEYSEGRLEELNGEVVLKTEKIGKLQAQLRSAGRQSWALEGKFARSNEESAKLQSQVKKLKFRKEQLETSNRELMEEFALKENLVQDLEARLDEQNKRALISEEHKNKLEVELRERLEQNDKLQTQLKEMGRQSTRLAKDYISEKEQVKSLREGLKTSESRAAETGEDLRLKERQIQSLQMRYDQLRVKIERLKKSRTYRIGQAFADITHHPFTGLLKLPIRLARISLGFLKRKLRSTKPKAKAVEKKPAPESKAQEQRVRSVKDIQPDAEELVFHDSFEGGWDGWSGNQQVRLGKNGSFVSHQDRSTPGIRKENVTVEPNCLYQLTIRGSFRVINNRAFIRVCDSETGLDLAPNKMFSGKGKNSVAQVMFRTLRDTTRVSIWFLVDIPCVGDECVLQSARLVRCCEEEVYKNLRSACEDVRDGKIIASLASIPAREPMLRDAVSSLYPAVDSLRVFLNNYDRVPEFLLREKIEVCRSQEYGDNGDAGKFFWCDTGEEGFRFVCDDDLVFPPDYVPRMLSKLRDYDYSAILGIHSILVKQPLREYYNPEFRHVRRYVNECDHDYCAHFLGTGAVAYHTSAISLKKDQFMFRNMADIWLALEAQRQGVPMISIERPRNWLVQNNGVEDTLSIYNHSATKSKTALDSSLVQSNVVRNNHPFTVHTPKSGSLRRLKVVLGITTYNRWNYLEQCIASFMETRSPLYEWILVIADDGSTDGTLDFLEKLNIQHEIHIVRNNRRYAVGQTNSIFGLCREIAFDVGFKVDDDVVFKKSGWDDLYINALQKSGWQHLCYLNQRHFIELRKKENPDYSPPPIHADQSGLCEALTGVSKCMGALFTFTPEVLEKVGIADEANFPIRGQWHQDFSARCCRTGFNDSEHMYDAKGSNDFIELQNYIDDEYSCSLEWGDEYKKTKEPAELERRRKIISDESRILVAPPEKQVKPAPKTINQFFDRIYALNLDRRPDRWSRLVGMADRHDIIINRFPAVDGYQKPNKQEWEQYYRGGLVACPQNVRPVNNPREYYLDYDSDIARVAFWEKRYGKKAIQSPGAWGYLLAMIKLLEQAMEEDLESLLVLDDDAVFHRDINKLFKEYVRQVPDNWKILQLGTLQYNWEDNWISWHSENLYCCNGSSIASHAVGIHRSVFPLLLNHCYRFDLPYDEGPLHKAKYIFPKQSLTFFPNLIIQDTRESDIASSMVQQSEGTKEDNVYRWKLNDYDFDLIDCKNKLVTG